MGITGFGIWGLGLGWKILVECLQVEFKRIRVKSLRFGVWEMLGLGFRVPAIGFGVSGCACYRVSGCLWVEDDDCFVEAVSMSRLSRPEAVAMPYKGVRKLSRAGG